MRVCVFGASFLPNERKKRERERRRERREKREDDDDEGILRVRVSVCVCVCVILLSEKNRQTKHVACVLPLKKRKKESARRGGQRTRKR